MVWVYCSGEVHILSLNDAESEIGGVIFGEDALGKYLDELRALLVLFFINIPGHARVVLLLVALCEEAVVWV